MALHFTEKEFENRKTKVLKSMKEQNIKALLMFKQESMYWLTGYDSFGFVFFQTLILKDDGEIVLLTRAPDLRQSQNTSNIKNIIIWKDKERSNPTDILKNILFDLKLNGKNIGIEYDSYGLTGRNTLKLNNSLKDFGNLNDKSELISHLRVIKSDEEIVYVKKAAELADNALEAAWKTAKAGIDEGKILAEMGKYAEELGVDIKKHRGQLPEGYEFKHKHTLMESGKVKHSYSLKKKNGKDH